MKQKFDFDKVIYRFGEVEKELYQVLANKTKSYFLSSWRKQAWDGVSWKPPMRQSKKGGSKRNTAQTLVQSGALRRAVGNSLVTANNGIIRFVVTDVPYAAIHNYGLPMGRGRGVMPRRQFMGDNMELRNIQKKTIKDYLRKIW